MALLIIENIIEPSFSLIRTKSGRKLSVNIILSSHLHQFGFPLCSNFYLRMPPVEIVWWPLGHKLSGLCFRNPPGSWANARTIPDCQPPDAKLYIPRTEWARCRCGRHFWWMNGDLWSRISHMCTSMRIVHLCQSASCLWFYPVSIWPPWSCTIPLFIILSSPRCALFSHFKVQSQGEAALGSCWCRNLHDVIWIVGATWRVFESGEWVGIWRGGRKERGICS